MVGPVVIDTNLLLLLVVGAADRNLIAKHKRLAADYTVEDFERVAALAGAFTDILILPNILTEVSNFARQIGDPARSQVQRKLAEFIELNPEIYVASGLAILREEFAGLGLTDAAILHLCAMPLDATLLSVDADLINAASALGYGCIDYNLQR